VPPRTTVCETVSAAAYGGGAQDATSGIQGAIDRCPEGQVVQLSAGTFAIDGTSDVLYLRKGITLRGAGAGVTLLRRTNGAQDGQDAVGVAMPVLIVGQSR
jgi:polygalacturonase